MNLKSCAGPSMYKKKRGAFHQTLLIMRLTGLLIIIFCFNVTASVLAQQITLNIKDQPLEKAFDAIKKQSGYQFFYNDHLLDNTNKVSINLKNANLQNALDECFKNQPISYEIIGKSIVVKVKLQQQKIKVSPPTGITIKGMVTDTIGKPIQGAVIKVEGTNLTTITQQDGSYEIKDVPQNGILIISAIGYKTESIPVADVPDSYLRISLRVNITSLSQVSIVSTGYQQIPQERATGSFTQIDNALLNRSVSTDVISKLKGITSGLNFDYSSNNSLGISIRGRSTLVSNTQPLIVLDNFPYEGDINSINPNDVESVTILKDAAASSIWGALAGNGVIVITTKKGKYNQPLNIDFNSNLTLQKKPNLFYAGNQFLNSADYIGVEKMLFINGFYDSQLSDQTNFPAVSPAVEILNNLKTGTINDTQANQQLTTLGEHDVRNDLNKYFYRTSTLQQYSLNLHGGSENINYIFSAGEDNDLQNEIGNKYNRLTLNSNVTFRPIKKLEIYTNLNYTNSNTTANSNASTLIASGYLYPYAKLADDQGNPLPINKYYSSAFINAASGSGLLDWSYSPLEELRDADNTSNISDIRINTGFKYNFIKGFSTEIRYQYEKAATEGRSYGNENTYEVRNLVNQFSIIDNGSVVKNIPMGGILDLSNNTVISNYARGQLNYNNQWKSGEINFIAGVEIRQIEGNGNHSRLYGYDSNTGTSQAVNYADFLPTNPGGGESLIPSNSGITQTTDRYRSLFSNASYNYKDRYVFSASARFDQSNLFGVNTNQKGVPLWSSGFKWNISNEGFYKIEWLPKLDFRATYGYSGNVNKSVSAYTIAAYQNSSNVLAYNYAFIVYPGNPDLRWEKVGMINLGIDFELKKTLTGSIEYYHKDGSDLIGTSPLAASTGFLAATGNFANIVANGVDLVLQSRNITRNEFSWNTNLLFSYSIDRVTKFLGGNSNAISNPIVVGAPYNSIYVNKFEGLNANGDPQGILNGQISTDYGALNNLPNSNKQFYRIQPAYFGSIRNDFSYRHLTLSFNILYKAGYSFLRNGINYGNLFNQGIGNADFTKRWQKPGDELQTDVPSMIYPDNTARDQFYANSTAHVSDASNVRLQDINLNYQFDKKNWPTIPFKSFQAYLYFNNLGLIWKANKNGIDPDYMYGLVTPFSASIGLKIGLN